MRRLAGVWLRFQAWAVPIVAGLGFLLAVAGCSPETGASNPWPTEQLPTLIAMTVQAGLPGANPGMGTEASRAAGQELETPLATIMGPVEIAPLIDPALVGTLTPPATIQPSPTLAPQTASPTPPEEALAETSTPTRSPTAAPPTRTPTRTPTLLVPEANVQIREPGPASKVRSPLLVRATVRLGSSGRVQLELLGEDGRLLVRKVLTYNPEVRWIYLDESLEFEISAVAEVGRLRVITFDQQGRESALASCDILLLSMGSVDLNPPGELGEAVIIQEPIANKFIQGGVVLVKGVARVPSEQPLLVELITPEGKVAGYRQAYVLPDPAGGYLPFEVEVPYQVSAATWVRMMVKMTSDGRIPGVIYLTSLEIYLAP